ncbi:MAG: ATP-binding protein [Flammeovirgaceae bacterium]
MQIKTKLTLNFTALVISILALAFVLLYYIEKKEVEEEFYNRLKSRALTSATLLLQVEKIDPVLLKSIDIARKNLLLKESVSIYDTNYAKIYTSNDSVDFKLPEQTIQSIMAGKEKKMIMGNFRIVGMKFTQNNNNYCIIAGAINDYGEESLKSLKKILAFIFTSMVFLVAIAGWFFSKRALLPIEQVMYDVENLSTINLSERLKGYKNDDEIGRMIGMFNKLLARIENSFNLQKTFVTNVSHELKNPLAKITSQLEVTLLKDRMKEEYRSMVKSVLDDINELNKLSNTLLELASIQNNKSFQMESTRIDEILWDVRENIESINGYYKVQFRSFEMPENEADLCIQGNPYLLKTAFQNLIENACKFSADNTASVSLLCTSQAIEIKILDKGPGIPEEELENIFQPFYRVNSTSTVKGYGIGLSLSQKIIDIHKGRIEFKSTVGVGTQVNSILSKINLA